MPQFFIDPSLERDEKFSQEKFFEFFDDFDPLNSAFLKELRALESQGQYKVKKHVGRPDSISNKIYGTTQLYWVIMYYNSIIDPDEIKLGDTLEFPRLPDLERLVFFT